MTLASAWPLAASAHVVKSDGQITALLHVNPYDEPFTGRPANLVFSVTDASSRFAAADCDCHLTVERDGHRLTDQTLAAKTSEYGPRAFVVPYTFGASAVYTIRLAGRPRAAPFQAFALSYIVRVGPPPTSGAAGLNPYVAGFVVLMVIAAAGLAVAGVQLSRQPRSAKQPKEIHRA